MSSLREYSKNIYTAGDGSDFSIFVFDKNGSKIEKKVHKYIIRRSPYFYAMLNLNGTEAREGCVTIENILSDTMEHVLMYLYTDELSVATLEEVMEITSAASYLQLDALKTIAVAQWKGQVMSMQPKDALVAFRAFAEANLQVKPGTDADWQEIMDSVLTGLHPIGSEIATESTAFMELFINYFGSTHPYLSMELLADWELGIDIELSEAVLESRKQTAADLVININAQKLTLRTLANLSSLDAFPSDYILRQIQKKAEGKDTSVCGEVVYTVLTTKNRIVELEHETGYLLFHFRGFKEGVYKDDSQVWRILRRPIDCEPTVSILSPQDRNKNLIWWNSVNADTFAGTFSETSKAMKITDDNGVVALKIGIKCKNNQPNGMEVQTQPVHQYTYDFTLK